ncbi:MAG: hypothetical protein L3K15_09470, partial [Thermoplasmata archaeon]|nr:hypothetical protein [Thermoplasmata archaeon]
MYWIDAVWATYVPSYCVGHDEPTTSWVSTAAGSGANVRYRLSLPADGVTYTQGDFTPAIWFGGVVYDVNSTKGGSQAFLEFQFYPAPPMYTGTGSGAQDCLPNGAFNPVYTAGSNTWFACAVVWQLTGTVSTVEDTAFVGPLNAKGTSAILLLHSNDQLFLNYSGVAMSTTQGWNLSVVDTTTGGSGNVTLQNGTLVLPPEYSTAAVGNSLRWGASNPGAISYAYEIGHSLNPVIPATCVPGDGVCDSYWPGRYAAAGQAMYGLPVLGSAGSQTFPTTMYFSSSQGGEAEVNASTCAAPSFSTATNCMMPYFQYRGGSYSFTFGTTNVTNATHDYGNEYQFPAVTNGFGQWAGDTRPAPWGTLSVAVTPATATVDFNPLRRTVAVPVSGGMATGQFVEGPYWLNVSAPGCVSSSTFVYLKTGAVHNTPVVLICAGSYAVVFTESGLAPGTFWSVTFGATTQNGTGTSITLYGKNGTTPYSVLSPAPGTAGIRYVAAPSSGTVTIAGAPVAVPVPYSTQYLFSGVASPANGGTVTPASTWAAAGATIQAYDHAAPSFAFASWTG